MISKEEIRDYIAKEFLPGDNPVEIAPDLDLIGTGIIDSLGVLKLVAFIERTNALTVSSEDLELERFATINSIHALVADKVRGSAGAA